MAVDLTKQQTWALGTEVTLQKDEDEEIEVNLEAFPKVIEDFDDDPTETIEEKGAAGSIEILEANENENNPEMRDKLEAKMMAL